jgi:hypothetical protein
MDASLLVQRRLQQPRAAPRAAISVPITKKEGVYDACVDVVLHHAVDTAPASIAQLLQEPFTDSAIVSPDMRDEYNPARYLRDCCYRNYHVRQAKRL